MRKRPEVEDVEAGERVKYEYEGVVDWEDHANYGTVGAVIGRGRKDGGLDGWGCGQYIESVLKKCVFFAVGSTVAP